MKRFLFSDYLSIEWVWRKKVFREINNISVTSNDSTCQGLLFHFDKLRGILGISKILCECGKWFQAGLTFSSRHLTLQYSAFIEHKHTSAPQTNCYLIQRMFLEISPSWWRPRAQRWCRVLSWGSVWGGSRYPRVPCSPAARGPETHSHWGREASCRLGELSRHCCLNWKQYSECNVNVKMTNIMVGYKIECL